MDSRNLDLAHEFCTLVDKPHLLAYLGLPEDAAPEVAQKKLKARRKYMQGMQSNPKYKAEAIFLIKNFGSLSAVLESPIPYIKDAKRRAESRHLPVLEMTIKGVLVGGSLTHDQEDFLRRNATELGVSEASFEEVLDRLCGETGVQRASAALSVSPEELKSYDFYQLLGVPRHATRDAIYARYRAKTEESKQIADPRAREKSRTEVEKAWKVLSDEPTRREYDLAWARTGPPARNREVTRARQDATAPPVRARGNEPTPPSAGMTPARLELLSRTSQRVPIGDERVTVTLEVRNGGEMPLRGTVTSDQSWLVVESTTLRSDVRQQQVRVTVDPTRVPEGDSAKGTVRIVSENGETATVEFEATRTMNNLPVYVAGGVAAGLVLLVVIGVFYWFNQTTPYVIEIDPWATEVLVDGKSIGTGGRVVLPEDWPDGEATLTVRHPNFHAWEKDIVVESGGTTRVMLELSAPMDQTPELTEVRATLSGADADRIMSDFRPQLDRCLRSGMTAGSTMQGTLRIHVGKDGYTRGLSLKGDGDDSPAILTCIKRQSAGPVFAPLKDGDFATVKYDYRLSIP